MSRSIVFPLLALCGIILYGTTQASQPSPESMMEMDRAMMRADRVVLSPDRGKADQASTPPSGPTPPPAPRLRSNEEPDVEPSVSEPEPSDSSAAPDRVVPVGGGVPVTTSSSRYDADGHPVEGGADDL